ncbi:hypothetical protein ACV35Z_37720, partial [Pseudomonas aeruginosa]
SISTSFHIFMFPLHECFPLPVAYLRKFSLHTPSLHSKPISFFSPYQATLTQHHKNELEIND